jgi:hypothetical protein
MRSWRVAQRDANSLAVLVGTASEVAINKTAAQNTALRQDLVIKRTCRRPSIARSPLSTLLGQPKSPCGPATSKPR